jgi:hypothetical protein
VLANGLQELVHVLRGRLLEVAWVEQRRAFDSLDDAIERFAESVAVDNDPEQRRRLGDALAARLEPLGDGRLASPVRRYPLATVWWEAGALAKVTPGTAPGTPRPLR